MSACSDLIQTDRSPYYQWVWARSWALQPPGTKYRSRWKDKTLSSPFVVGVQRRKWLKPATLDGTVRVLLYLHIFIHECQYRSTWAFFLVFLQKWFYRRKMSKPSFAKVCLLQISVSEQMRANNKNFKTWRKRSDSLLRAHRAVGDAAPVSYSSLSATHGLFIILANQSILQHFVRLPLPPPPRCASLPASLFCTCQRRTLAFTRSTTTSSPFSRFYLLAWLRQKTRTGRWKRLSNKSR